MARPLAAARSAPPFLPYYCKKGRRKANLWRDLPTPISTRNPANQTKVLAWSALGRFAMLPSPPAAHASPAVRMPPTWLPGCVDLLYAGWDSGVTADRRRNVGLAGARLSINNLQRPTTTHCLARRGTFYLRTLTVSSGGPLCGWPPINIFSQDRFGKCHWGCPTPSWAMVAFDVLSASYRK